MPQIIHQQRLAWDGARAFVAAAEHDQLYFWLSDRVLDVLGPEHQLSLSDTRSRLGWSGRGDIAHVEAGRWRARLEGVLRERPELAVPLKELVTDIVPRLAERDDLLAAGWA